MGARIRDRPVCASSTTTVSARRSVPRGSVAYVAHRVVRAALGDTKIKASAGLGIKEPTLVQSFSQSPFFLGNPDLDR